MTTKRAPNMDYAKGNVRRHHHWAAGLIHLVMTLFPWAAVAALAGYITFQEKEDPFCSVAGVVPDRFLCTNIRECNETAYWNSVASLSMNAQVRAQCGPVTNEVTMTIPYETYAPDKETIALIKAEIGDIKAWQRDKVIQSAVAEMGGPD